ncbi:glycosyltransferase family 9 protein [Salinimonas lutimaris]|uniref:glycosyltransferase family 9 protein n=1 Tax=Salinimonas lutimaris TaxID=914153 RepID=UPI001585FF81|nr:glycosyltransferase family 9 protein [Salinimonas lutimaris]
MSHLALGDYVYQGALLKQLHDDYPHLSIDVWFDDCRESPKEWAAGRNHILSQWLEHEPHIDQLYPIAHNKAERKKAIERARASGYDAVVFFTTLRSHRFADIALTIADGKPVYGAHETEVLRRIRHRKLFARLAGQVLLSPSENFSHISQFYRHYFEQLLAFRHPPSDYLRITVPQQYQAQARQWKERHAAGKPLVLLNHLSTTAKRDWRLSQVTGFIMQLQQKVAGVYVVINALEHQHEEIQTALKAHGLESDTSLFCATEHFLELPAMLEQADLVVSVETAIMHLAASVGTPCISLVREQAAQWFPLGPGKVLIAGNRVDTIAPAMVIGAAVSLLHG